MHCNKMIHTCDRSMMVFVQRGKCRGRPPHVPAVGTGTHSTPRRRRAPWHTSSRCPRRRRSTGKPPCWLDCRPSAPFPLPIAPCPLRPLSSSLAPHSHHCNKKFGGGVDLNIPLPMGLTARRYRSLRTRLLLRCRYRYSVENPSVSNTK